MPTKNELLQGFSTVFEKNDCQMRVFYAPGRVNLIGEHIDYNGGYVFPCTLNLGTYGVARKRSDYIIRLVSSNVDLHVTADVRALKNDVAHSWANYPKGVAAEFLKLGYDITGFDLFVSGDIPSGAGLSSSASIELLTAAAINNLFDLNLSMKDLALLCQRAENKFVGVNCGIMDQYSVGLGKKGYALLLDCLKIEHEYVPFDLGPYKMIISNSKKKHSLVDSKYNERREESNEAARILGVEFLCSADAKDLDKIKDETIRRRAEHAIYENIRVQEAVKALKSGDLPTFGKLMNKAHESIRDLYEASCPEIDILTQAAWDTKNVLGSRMTGGGFGGCTISIVAEDTVEHFIQSVGAEYLKKTGIEAEFYIAQTGMGAGEI